MNAFFKLHPIVMAIYFLAVILITMFSSNPIILAISLVASICVYICILGFQKLQKQLRSFAVIIVLCTVSNPLFSKNGNTILLEFWKIKITAQSLLFGISVGVMLVCSIIWFLSLSTALSSQKIMYLFGKRMPKVALTISLSLRLVPEFFKKFQTTAQSQKALGLFGQDSFRDRIKASSNVFLSVCADVLESSTQTSDSMRARGFGLNKHSAYSSYKFFAHDAILLVIIVALLGTIAICEILGGTEFNYYPCLSPLPLNLYNLCCYTSFALFAFLPVIITVKEDVTWKYSMSKS
ncbi:MAG: energy-coupling factor transporter transmembrane component T [Oscillospiraceae bacterium]